MNAFERWFILRVLRKEVRQGPYHTVRIRDFYRMVRNAATLEFTEDNAPTMDAFLRKVFEETQSYPVETPFQGLPQAPNPLRARHPGTERPPMKPGWNHSEEVVVYYAPREHMQESVGRWGIAYFHYAPPFEENNPHWVNWAERCDGVSRTPTCWWPLSEWKEDLT